VGIWRGGGLLFLLAAFLSLGAADAQEPPKPLEAPTSDDVAAGRKLFDAQCTRCHGREGSGGAGPGLRRPKLRRAPDEAALVSVVRDGIRGTSMPANFQLTDRELVRVAAYVRTLGRLPSEVPPGSPERGRGLFTGRGGCPACHIVGGTGQGLGPDLSEIGLLRGPDHLAASLLDPGAELPLRAVGYEPGGYAAYLLVKARLADGVTVQGYRVNEDTFTIQLREASGRLRSLRKADLASLEKLPGQSPMPSYKGVFSPAELQDLVAYLASLKGGE